MGTIGIAVDGKVGTTTIETSARVTPVYFEFNKKEEEIQKTEEELEFDKLVESIRNNLKDKKTIHADGLYQIKTLSDAKPSDGPPADSPPGTPSSGSASNIYVAPGQRGGRSVGHSINHEEDEENLKVMVQNLTSDMDEETIRKIFNFKEGYVKHVYISRYPDGQVKGFAFVKFSTPEAADKALEMDGSPIKGYHVIL
eukprot:CAMPEP_0117425288 /NCGR_PEP_ID=MMETSP0758-20121206/5579_1 /TAXON_ID=63605 /ORGANISM="Percolomonas cosmopolitus, Strain AE-1 (ATCC 50343)" /LENGTH=197 /DNA_ID=CAMNT_0005209661 /DNA_START=174 /DNA_END=764 /DNA_ORIENTATION=+